MAVYLCCVFAPDKNSFKESMGFYSDIAEWVGAKNSIEASRKYKEEYRNVIGPEALKYVRVFTSMEGDQAPKDGESGRDLALETMKEYYRMVRRNET